MIKKHSNNVLSADNQQERLNKINPWYVAGFVEGEGTFHVALYKDVKMKTGIKVIPEFHVNQSQLRLETLKAIKRYFNCGYLKQNHAKRKEDDTYVFVVRNRQDLMEKIIPFFQKYKFLSNKQKTFKLFRKIVELMNQNKHLTKSGVKMILNLAYKMNQQGKYRKKNKADLLI